MRHRAKGLAPRTRAEERALHISPASVQFSTSLILVPWVFFATSAVGVALAVNVLRPVRTPPSLSIVSFFAGWLVGELAMHALVAQVAAAILFVAIGGLRAWPGEAALALTGVACALLLVAQRRASLAGVAFDESLHRSLGDALDATPSPRIAEWLQPAASWRRVAFPFPVRHPQVERIHRVAFHEVDGVTLRLDVHRRRGAPARAAAPTLIYVHGGGWVIGHRDRQGLPLLQHLAARGWVGFSIDYRLSPRATFPEHLVDVKRAIAWVREHGAEYGADTGFLVLAGNSAGAHLAALAALTPNDPLYQPGFEGADTSVDACLAFYGVHDLLDRWGHWRHDGMKDLLERRVMKKTRAEARDAFDAGSPVARVHAGAPPFLLVHGTLDTLAPVEESRRLHEALAAASRAPVTLAEIPGAQHAFEIFPSVRTTHVLDGVSRFLAAVAERRRGPS
jgi:acetyl esterase/lipase